MHTNAEHINFPQCVNSCLCVGVYMRLDCRHICNMWEVYIVQIVSFVFLYTAVLRLTVQPQAKSEYKINLYSFFVFQFFYPGCSRCSCAHVMQWWSFPFGLERKDKFQIKSNHFYCHITTAQVPWWVKFLWACSRQCKNFFFTYLQYTLL